MLIKKKVVYVGLAADILHEGHMNLLEFASKYGEMHCSVSFCSSCLFSSRALSTCKAGARHLTG